MAFDFRAKAQEAVSNSFLQVGRTKGKLDDLENRVVTIIGVDRNEGPRVDADNNIVSDPETGEVEMTMYTTITIAEEPEKFYGGCNELDRIVDSWLSGFDSAQECSAELERCGGVKVRPHMERKRGRNIRKFDIL